MLKKYNAELPDEFIKHILKSTLLDVLFDTLKGGDSVRIGTTYT